MLAPGASFGPSKQWPPGHFARAADALAAPARASCWSERPASVRSPPRWRPRCARRAADLSGRIGLGALKAVVRRARVALCNDAGVRHVAVAFGVPCVVLMGPTSLEKTALNLERVSVLTEDVAVPALLPARVPDRPPLPRRGSRPSGAVGAALPALGAGAAARGAA